MGAIESVQRSMRRAATSELPSLNRRFLGQPDQRTIYWALGNSHRYYVCISEDWSR